MGKKMERILVTETFFAAGIPKYIAGVHYEITDETESLVAQRLATRVTLDFDPEVDAAQKARAAATDAHAVAAAAVANAVQCEEIASEAEAVVANKLEAAAEANPSLLDRVKSVAGINREDLVAK